MLRKPFRSGFSLIEISIVLAIIGILMGIVSVFLSDFFSFLKYKNCKQKLEAVQMQILAHKWEVLNDPAVFFIPSQAFLVHFPKVCQFSEESSMKVNTSFLKVISPDGTVKKDVVFVIGKDCGGNLFKWHFEDDNLVRITSGIYKAVGLNDLKRLCPQIENPLSLDVVEPKSVITSESSCEFLVLYPPERKYSVKVIYPEGIKELSEGNFYVTVPLKDGLNEITFILFEGNREIHRTQRYIVKIPEDAKPLKITVKSKKNTVILTPARRYKNCVVDFGDGTFKFFPVCEKAIVHTYDFRGEYTIKLFGEDSKEAFLEKGKVKVSGPPKPKIKFQVAEGNDELTVKLQIGNQTSSLVCFISENGKLLGKVKNCSNVSVKEKKKGKRVVVIKVKGHHIVDTKAVVIEGNEWDTL